MSQPLTRVICWGHELLAEVLRQGDLAVDLTAGNGQDCLRMAQLVGLAGQVIAFDIQSAALDRTGARLLAAGYSSRRWEAADSLERQAGIDLVCAGHERLAGYLPGQPRAIVANLGYLPGGDPALTTRPESTLAALEQACRLLAVGGRLAVVVYVGHPGGMEEGTAVSRFFSGLDEALFQVLKLQVANRPQAPYLLVAEKMRDYDDVCLGQN